MGNVDFTQNEIKIFLFLLVMVKSDMTKFRFKNKAITFYSGSLIFVVRLAAHVSNGGKSLIIKRVWAGNAVLFTGQV